MTLRLGFIHTLSLTLITSTCVQELDEAARRRLPKQLYIPLPCAHARRSMIERQLGPSSGVASALTPDDIAKIVEKTAGYSGTSQRSGASSLAPRGCCSRAYCCCCHAAWGCQMA